MKLLHWQGDGFAIFYKRLEKGRFEIPLIEDKHTARISSQQLMLIVEGIKLSSVKKHKRYEQIAV